MKRRQFILHLAMKCPNCAIEMTAMTLESRMEEPIPIDVCEHCQSFWFDKFESLRLSPGSSIKLIRLMQALPAVEKAPPSHTMRCPRCATPLIRTHDIQ